MNTNMHTPASGKFDDLRASGMDVHKGGKVVNLSVNSGPVGAILASVLLKLCKRYLAR